MEICHSEIFCDLKIIFVLPEELNTKYVADIIMKFNADLAIVFGVASYLILLLVFYQKIK